MALRPSAQLALTIARFEAEVASITWKMIAENLRKPPRKKREVLPATPANVKMLVWKDHLMPSSNDRVKWTRNGKTFYRCLGPHASLPDTYVFHLDGSPSYCINVKFATLFNRWKFSKP